MNTRRYRAAIIGTGRIASLLERDPLRPKPHTHAGWYTWSPRTELVAGCDVDAGRLGRFGEDWGIPPAGLFDDYREMLDRVRPDIVSICAYAPDRRAMIEAAVERGARGLWIEKAVACSIDEARAIARLLGARRVAAVVDQPRRGAADYLGVKQIIDGRAWGRLQSVHCLSSGHLMHTGIHAWDVLRLWCGDWTAAAAWLATCDNGRTADEARRGAAAAFDVGALEASAGGAVPAGRVADRIEDRGGHAHILFADGTHAFVSGGLKDYYIFQFDLIFERGRVRLGNDIDETGVPAPSPRYSGFLELAPAGAVPRAGDTVPMVMDLVDAMDGGGEPRYALRHAIDAFSLGVALFQSEMEAHRYVHPGEVRPDLYVHSI
jgi:predicted dehydrogenase